MDIVTVRRPANEAGVEWHEGIGFEGGFCANLEILQRFASAAQAHESSQAVLDVIAERRRQVGEEGWTPDHDDGYHQGQLATAAGHYAISAGFATKWWRGDTTVCETPIGWPWARTWWKPTNSRRDLVKAAALILAEIERLDRLESPEAGG